jgi:hypothetical protein
MNLVFWVLLLETVVSIITGKSQPPSGSSRSLLELKGHILPQSRKKLSVSKKKKNAPAIQVLQHGSNAV